MELHSNGREWHGSNPFESGATDDGFILFEKGNAFDRKINRSYSAKEIRERLGIEEYVNIYTFRRRPQPKPVKKKEKIDYSDWSKKEYVYTQNGINALKVVRLDPPPESQHRKKFIQMKWDNEKWEYGAPKMNLLYREDLVDSANTVFIVEGEKCADKINDFLQNSPFKGEIAATTVPGGASQAKKWYGLFLTMSNKPVFVIPDNDEPGLLFATTVMQCNEKAGGVFASIIRLDVEEKEDIVDWIDKGGDFYDVIKAAKKARAEQTQEIWV